MDISETAPPLRGPVVATQQWRHVAFVHWRVPRAEVAPFLPRGVVPDVIGGSTWVGLIAFRLGDARVARLPPAAGVGVVHRGECAPLRRRRTRSTRCRVPVAGGVESARSGGGPRALLTPVLLGSHRATASTRRMGVCVAAHRAAAGPASRVPARHRRRHQPDRPRRRVAVPHSPVGALPAPLRRNAMAAERARTVGPAPGPGHLAA